MATMIERFHAFTPDSSEKNEMRSLYFCGSKVNSGEYKLMGLAPYGEPKYLAPYGEPKYKDLILERLLGRTTAPFAWTCDTLAMPLA
jgi:hypothetical protein